MKKIISVLWRIINKLPNKGNFNRLRTAFLKKNFPRVKVGKNVVIGPRFYFPRDVDIEIGDNTEIKADCDIYYDPKATGATHSLRIGKNCTLLSNVTLDCSDTLTIGDDAHIGRDVKIFTHNHILSNPEKKMDQSDVALRSVSIGDNSVLYDEVTILYGSSIPDGCVVGTKSLVSKKFTTPNMIISGIPADEIRGRYEQTQRSS